MSPKLISLRKTAAAFALTLVAVLAAGAQNPPSYMEGKTAEQVYKNIQVLQGTPAEQLIETMHLIKGALGVECELLPRLAGVGGQPQRRQSAQAHRAQNDHHGAGH